MISPLTREQKLELYYYMQLDRRLEERMARLFRQNKIVGGLYSSRGQEAVSVGTAFALEPRDWMGPLIWNIGALLVKGFKPRDIFTQHMARFNSPTKGRDGASHIGDLGTHHVIAPTSMLGDLIPVMTGVAMAGRYLGQNIVAMTWIGDGGTSTGAFHEGLNLAASQRAPFVLIIENNQWAYSTPVSRQVPIRNLVDRAVAYGITGKTVDGNDVLAVYNTAKEAVEECRAGRGPVLIEAKTMRIMGHAQHDSAEYVPQEMLEAWKARDPIALYETHLTENKLWDANVKSEIDARIERELDADQTFAEESPMPPVEFAEQGVYCEGCHTIEADWQRPKEQNPPLDWAVEVGWTEPTAISPSAPSINSSHAKASGDGLSRPVTAEPRQASKVPSRVVPVADPEGPGVKRVPFGRGPKDKSFRQRPHGKRGRR